MSSERSHRRLYRFSEWLTEGLIYFAVVFGPWAFGTTQAWSIQVMNGVGLALGLLWLVKTGLRAGGGQALRWSTLSRPGGGEDRRAPERWPAAERGFTRLLAVGTICILLFCLVSAWNARAIYQPDQWHFAYRPAVPWLPHSYDQAASWAAFWKYLALAGLFWALRDWLLTLSPREVARVAQEGESALAGTRLPVRLRRLFWVLAANGTVLAIQGLMQRAEGGNQLLWLVEPGINKTADAQFGAYAYRSNAAQYFNLLWPAVLGFWWAGVSSLRRRRTEGSSTRQNRLAVLLPCVLIMAVCPLVSASRGGAIVLLGSLIMAGGILLLAQWRKSWRTKAGLLLGMGVVVGGGALLGWQTLAPRMEMLHEGYAGREGLYLAGRYMAQDNAWFGTGPGTFATMYQLYRRAGTDEWLAFMHNDWLETLITFGRLGTAPIFLTLLLVLAHWFRGGGIYGNKYFVMLLWVALGGCLVHAAFDFPLQIHSVLTLFLVLCAVLSCLTRREMNAG
jgi:O-antigen ligase